jgi:hypothetical protein
MHLATLIVAAALNTPPGIPPENHAQPGHYAYPTIRVFRRERDDDYRRERWELFVQELKTLWSEYRQNRDLELPLEFDPAWKAYNKGLAEARYWYLERDIYLVPIPPLRDDGPDRRSSPR